MVQETGPQYFIRIFTSDGEINPNNIFSINTSKDLYSDTGSWSIEMNYDQHFFDKSIQNSVTYSQDSVFFKVKPMDYVEIYLSHQLPETGFGVYDINGQFVRNFDETVNSSGSRIKQDLTTTSSLDIVERILNPHLVFCGFVDAVDNNFAIGENSTNNRVIIRGRCLSKFLINHHLFFNFPFSDLLLKQVEGQIALLGLRPNEAIDLVLSTYCQAVLSNNEVKFVKQSVVDKAGGIAAYTKKIEKTPAHIIVWGDEKDSEYFSQIIHNADPSFNNIYWGTNLDSARSANVPNGELIPQKGYFDWGRMEYVDSINRNIFNISSDSPVFNLCKQSAQLPFNEFFVDEVGNVVMRKALDAWDYNSQSTIDTQQNKLIKDWVELKEEDIISWNFSISDDELKTLILSIPCASVFANAPIMAGTVGMAPVLEETVQEFAKESEKSFKDDLQTLQLKNKGTLTSSESAKQKQELINTLQQIRQKQKFHLDHYDLSTREGILAFWARYGIRPESINDLYSDTFSKFYTSAWSLFQKYANFWWKGTFIVTGDAKYKIGQKGKIRNFAKDANNVIRNFNFYIHGVSHKFTWGEHWITQITFTRGEIENTQISQSIKPIQIKYSNQPNKKLPVNPATKAVQKVITGDNTYISSTNNQTGIGDIILTGTVQSVTDPNRQFNE